MSEESDGRDDRTPEEIAYAEAMERKLEESRALRAELKLQGWREEEGQLTHPDDIELNVWIDPFTGETFCSQKLAESIRDRLTKEPPPLPR